MGFGGGGSGAFSLPDHDHTNAALDGGELSDLVTLVDGVTLQSWLQTHIRATKQLSETASNQNITLGSFVDVTNLTLTMPNNHNKSIVCFDLMWYSAVLGAEAWFQILDDGVAQSPFRVSNPVANYNNGLSKSYVCENNGQVVKLQARTASSNAYYIRGGSNYISTVTSLELI